jgi:ribose-phosphate pyrophosphokinase
MKGKVFSIDGRVDFAEEIISELNRSVGAEDLVELGKVNIEKFSDGEMTVQYNEYVRGHKVFLICSTIGSDNIMKLMLAADAARRASAQEIIAVLPYYGYARQDRKDGLRGAVGAKVIANMLVANGVDRMVTVDLHADQIQGFFNMPVDHISGWNIFLNEIRLMMQHEEINNVTLCSPDAGGVKRVSKIFKKLVAENYDVEMAMFSKLRDKPNEVARLDLIGNVKGRDVIIIDDMVDTAGTLCGTASEIMKAGANTVRAICTHGILSGQAVERIMASELTEIILSDTVDTAHHEWFIEEEIYHSLEQLDKFSVVSCARQIARIIDAVCESRSADELKTVFN